MILSSFAGTLVGDASKWKKASARATGTEERRERSGQNYSGAAKRCPPKRRATARSRPKGASDDQGGPCGKRFLGPSHIGAAEKLLPVRERQHRPGPIQTPCSLKSAVKEKVLRLAASRRFYRATNIDYRVIELAGLDRAYLLLQDQLSKDLVVKLLAYRILGDRRLRLPLNNAEYWRLRRSKERRPIPISTQRPAQISTAGFPNTFAPGRTLLSTTLPTPMYASFPM